MKYGIYYAYWEKQWGGDFRPYVERVKKLGFDILEISCATLLQTDEKELLELRDLAAKHDIVLTGGYGPRECDNVASTDAAAVDEALRFFAKIFEKLKLLGIRFVGGGLYSYWPVDFSKPVDKDKDWLRSVSGIQRMADIAGEYDVTLGMEVLNRFEGYLLNTAAEALQFVNEVKRANVKIMLDTFHMNIEEDSFSAAIRLAGSHLGHLHLGESNRRVPGKGKLPWREIGEALHDIGFEGGVVMEPFVRMGGQIGSDIKVWRDLDSDLDRDAAESLAYIRYIFA